MSTVQSQLVQPMTRCIDRNGNRGRLRRPARQRTWSGRGGALCARAGSLELHEHERGGDRRRVALLAAPVALFLNVARTLDDVGQHPGELVPSLLVECERRAAEVNVRTVETAFGRGASKVTRDVADRRIGERTAQRGRQLLPVVIADQRWLERFVVVLDRSASRLGADQLDHLEVRKESHVVADVAKRLVELFRDLARTRDLLVEQREHPHSQGMRERLHDALVDGRLFGWRHASYATRDAGRGVGRMRTLTVNPAEAMHFLHRDGGRWRAATNLNGSSHAADAPSSARSAPRAASRARSMPASSTSRWVTARTRSGPTGSIPTPSRSSAAQNAGASGTPKMTMFVSTVAGSIATPGMPARPSARRRARAWSSARRSTCWSSAYRPAAATMPDWRIAPPSICFHRHASAMSSDEPARHAPTGAPRPFVKSSHAVSKSPAHVAASTPLATTAFISRA